MLLPNSAKASVQCAAVIRTVGVTGVAVQKAWSPPPYKANRGVLYKYIRTVRSASEGCVTDA